MATDIALSAAVRSSLLSLKNTSSLIDRTQGRLSTGLRVASAVDDAVSFFQAKSLSDRASDFNQKKDGIDQGISTLATALNATEAIERLVQQMKGLSQSMKSATGAQFTRLVEQFGEIRTQINNLTADATYQGVNLVNGTGQVLDVEFSEKTNSFLSVASVDLTNTGLGINEIAVAGVESGNSSFEAIAETAAIIMAARPVRLGTAVSNYTAAYTFTYQGPDDVFETGAYDIAYGTQILTIRVDNSAVAVTNGRVLEVAITTGVDATGNSTAGDFDNLAIVDNAVVTMTNRPFGRKTISTGAGTGVPPSGAAPLTEGSTAAINEIIRELDGALTTLRGQSAALGANVALLQTRLEFTEDYVNTLEGGSGKLTLADINEEGANLLALQTRQQLGISALSFAGQSEQSILALFN